MKNLMPEVAKLLGVEIGEEFKVKYGNSDNGHTYRITEKGIIDENELFYSGTLHYLLLGECSTVKLPWKPKNDDDYWIVTNTSVGTFVWVDSMFDYSCLKLGNCFRTKEEAEANADRIRKEIMGIDE